MPKAILLVEDSKDDVILFRQVMQRSGLRNPVIVVRDGREAIDYLKGEGKYSDRENFPLPQILMLDLKMPRVDGFQVLEWIKSQEHLGDMLIIVLSHFGHTTEIQHAYELGAHSFLLKPFKDSDLLNLAAHFDGRWERTPV